MKYYYCMEPDPDHKLDKEDEVENLCTLVQVLMSYVLDVLMDLRIQRNEWLVDHVYAELGKTIPIHNILQKRNTLHCICRG